MPTVYLSNEALTRIIRAGRSPPEFMKSAVNSSLDALEAAAEAPSPPADPPTPPAEPDLDDLERRLEGIEIDFSDIGNGVPTPTALTKLRPGSTLSEAAKLRLASDEPTNDDLRGLARSWPSKAFSEAELMSQHREFVEGPRLTPEQSRRMWIGARERVLGRPLSPTERTDLLKKVGRRPDLTPQERRV